MTGVEELDTLFPDMSMPRKLLILESAGKKAIERDQGYQAALAGIGSDGSATDGNSNGTPNTLEGINKGYQLAEAYIRKYYDGSNAAFLSGALGYHEAQRSAQLQQFVASKRATQAQDARNDFETTDKALAASGDWEALRQRDDFWKAAGGNGFIQGKDRNGYVTDAAYKQAKANRDITVLSTMPEEYKGVMRGKPALWQTYLTNVQREIDALNAQDVAAKMRMLEDEIKLREAFLRKKMINNETLSEQELREIEDSPRLSGSRARLRDNTGVDQTFSKANTTSIVGQLKSARTTEDLTDLGLTERMLNDPDELQVWASTQQDIHPQDVPTILAAAQEAYYINDVRNSDEHKRFNQEIESVLVSIRKVSILEGDSGVALGILDQDSVSYRRGKEIAENEFEELVAIYREENGNNKLTLKQIKEIRELVVAKTQKFVDVVKAQNSPNDVAKNLPAFTESLRNTSNQYKDPDTDVIYDVFDRVKALELRSQGLGDEIRQIGNNRFIQVE